MDVEAASASIDALIERRSRGVDPDEREGLWRESVRKYHARRREERLWERIRYHEAMIRAHTENFEELLRRHRVGLRLCEQALGLDDGERMEA